MGRLRNAFKSMSTGDWFAQVAQGIFPTLDDPPPLRDLGERERRMLTKWFIDDYGRYPKSEGEFQRWVDANW